VGRVSIFANEYVIKFVNENFIPVAGDDWYHRQRDDAVGKFFRAVAAQGPRGGAMDDTNQGLYCFTASGKLLWFRNTSDPGATLGALRQVVYAFRRLPAEEREPGAVKIPPLDEKKVDEQFARKLPEDALAVRVFARALERDENGKCKVCEIKSKKQKVGLLSSLDHMWIPAEEWRKLIPREAKAGDKFAMPESLALRIARFHLVDNTRGEPDMWTAEHVRKNDMSLTVVEATADVLKLRLEGNVLLSTSDQIPATSAEVQRGERGYDVALLGGIQVDRKKNAVTSFKVVALGDHWGTSRYTGEPRPGKAPLGIAFELADGKQAADAVPPQASRQWEEYLMP
jgi:hypothetical protein